MVVTWETLKRELGAPAAHLSWAGPLPGDTARRLGCDADLTRIVVTDGDGSAGNGADTSNDTSGHGSTSTQSATPGSGRTHGHGDDGAAPNTPAHRGGVPKPRAGPDRRTPGEHEPDRSDSDRSGPGNHGPGTHQTDGTSRTASQDRINQAIHAARRVDPALCHLLAGPSQVLDVGRKIRTIPPGLRKAIDTRDRHCQFPGCDIPAQWCDCHHIHHWSNGGPTDRNNLILLCGRHHQHVHEDGWTISRNAAGQPTFTPPGTEPPGSDPPEAGPPGHQQAA